MTTFRLSLLRDAEPAPGRWRFGIPSGSPLYQGGVAGGASRTPGRSSPVLPLTKGELEGVDCSGRGRRNHPPVSPLGKGGSGSGDAPYRARRDAEVGHPLRALSPHCKGGLVLHHALEFGSHSREGEAPAEPRGRSAGASPSRKSDRDRAPGKGGNRPGYAGWPLREKLRVAVVERSGTTVRKPLAASRPFLPTPRSRGVAALHHGHPDVLPPSLARQMGRPFARPHLHAARPGRALPTSAARGPGPGSEVIPTRRGAHVRHHPTA
ncbi:hypothetical protein OJF2_37100 [Aquisphaera giovannonii]|uniref:Uncharacterized protein n=1 Tax=Aquisphaera giovannonii TaxID=406548 RepID=A0A5B9W4U3_9BACT|nr:hypothetical protein OJF2_37100 [Aquisphaera giovannonii]